MYTFIEQIVADHMTRDVKTVTRSVSLGELGDLFEKDDFNAYPVEEGSQVVGLVSKFDYLAVSVRRSDGEPAKHDGTVAQTGTVSPVDEEKLIANQAHALSAVPNWAIA